MGFYTQVDDVAMGFPLGPSLANAFLCHHKTKWLNDYPNKFKPVFCKRYVDLKGTLSTSVREHMLDWNHVVA